MHQEALCAEEALQKLKDGNALFVKGDVDKANVSHYLREKTAREGQNPYAIIITCSDSRIVPDAVFSGDIGDLFIIRVAGNVIDDHQLGSIEYAAEHLGVKLVVVMGHDHCGAVDAAIHNDPSEDPEGFIKYVIDEVKQAIGDETDPDEASKLNVLHSVGIISGALQHEAGIPDDVQVLGAFYYLATGAVEFFE